MQQTNKDEKAVAMFKETQLLMNFGEFSQENKIKALQTFLMKGDL
jgi:hypothetical protein